MSMRGGGPRAHGGMGAMPPEKAIHFMATMRRILRELAHHRLGVFFILALTVAGVTAQVLGPKLLGHATNIIFDGIIGKTLPAGMTKAQAVAWLESNGQQQLAEMVSGMPQVVPGQGILFNSLASALFVVLGIYIASYLFNWMQGALAAHVVQTTMHRLRQRVEDKINRLPLKYFDSAPRGEILSRVTNDIDNLGQTLQQTLSQILSSLLTVIGVLVMMIYISLPLSIVAAVAIPLSAFLAALIAKRSGPQFAKQWKATGELNSHIEEMFTGHALVKVFGQQRQAQATFDKRNDAIYDASFKAQFISGIIPAVMGFVSNLTYVAVAVFGGLRVASGTMTLGDVQAFIQYSRQFTMPIGQIAAMANLLQSGAASAERVYDLLDAPDQVPDADGVLPAQVQGRIEFDEVDFSYDPNRELIRGLNLQVEPGQTVAIVGHTGAGKTTLVNLLMRFYDVDAGEIRIDGIETRTVPRHDLRDRMGMVLQDTWLFHDTIAANIAYGKIGATRAEVEAAATSAYVDRFVHHLPDGYETLIDEEGSNLSAGEKQLITIARAFLSDPEILILDEATSSVDTRTEVLVQEAMNKLRQGRTAFVIAHRLSTIRGADTIVVMADGDIVEQGNHDELIAAGGVYADLYQSQFAAAIDEE